MPTILPLITFALLFCLFYQNRNCWRSAVISSAVSWGVLLTCITETLNISRSLTISSLSAAWILSSVVCWFLYRNITKKTKHIKPQNPAKNRISDLIKPPLQILIVGIIFVITIVGLTAWLAPPNTMDSMHYHLVRVAYWMQNHSVNHYPTHFTPQLFLAPWAEFAILHFQILSGGDQYANFVQWFSMVGSVIGCSLIAHQLGANIYGQVFASVFCTTIPMGILQASSTQNDYVVTFWLVCLVHYILTAQSKPQHTALLVAGVGASLGLAMLTKPTAYLYSLPFLIWLFISIIKCDRWKLGRSLIQVGTPALLINISHYVRNFNLFHKPLGSPPKDIAYTNHVLSLNTFLSNAIRNLESHFSTPVSSFNHLHLKILSFVSSILNIDINDPEVSSSHFQFNSLINHEDLAGNALHLLIILATNFCFIWLLKNKKLHAFPLLLPYLLCTTAGFLIFCFVLVWTPFNTRLELPTFVLFSPFVACTLVTLLSERLFRYSAIALIILSFPWVFFNETRPVIANSKFLTTGEVKNIFNMSRTSQYFMTRPDLEAPFIEAAQVLQSKKCSNIGLSLRNHTFEYPLWVLLRQSQDKSYRLQHINVDNVSNAESNVYPFKDFKPCAIFGIHEDLGKMSDRQTLYQSVWLSPPYEILISLEDTSLDNSKQTQ